MTEAVQVGELSVAVHRADRETVRLTVERDGSLSVRAPIATSLNELETLVRRREVWIYSKLAEKEMLLRAWRPKQYIAGEGFMYLGRRYRLRLVDDPTAPALTFAGGWFLMRRECASDAPALFQDWYSTRGRDWLPSRVRRFVARVGVKASPVEVRDLGYRWGSCGVRRLHFHWRVMTLPPRIIDYVIVHELVHIDEPHHRAAFWDRVRQAMPDFEERRAWLAVHGGDS